MAIVSLVVIIIISRVFTGRITKPVEQITDAANKLKNGEIDAEINVKSNDEIGVMADAFREMIEYFQQRAEAMNQIASGDLSQTIMAKSEKDVLSLSINKMISTLAEMVEESRKLTAAAAAGELMQRGDAERFQGAYKDIVAGINQTLETITGPLQQAMRVLDRMSVNDYTTNMDGEYQGMIFEFADSINKVISRLQSVQDAFGRVAVGDFSRYKEFVDIGQRSDEDKLTPAIASMMGAVMKLSAETEKIASAAVSGNLEYRGDANAFSGSYRAVIDSLNMALDNIARPISEISEVLQAMADGDLGVSMKGSYEGSYEVMQQAINSTIQAMNQLISEIVTAADQVAAGAQQVSEGSMSLSQGSTEQASSVEELSASLTQIAAQTRQNAGNASQANALANTASEDADRGNSQMQAMLDAMNEITEYIETTINKVTGGTGIANETAESMQKIIAEILQVAELVDQIANASNEQASGIAQINQGIDQVSKVVQANSATSEQSAAASEELRQQAQYLTDNVRQFKL